MDQVEKWRLEIALSDALRAVREVHGTRQLTKEMWEEFRRRLPELIDQIDPWNPTQ
jgi:hypothetical protein